MILIVEDAIQLHDVGVAEVALDLDLQTQLVLKFIGFDGLLWDLF